MKCLTLLRLFSVSQYAFLILVLNLPDIMLANGQDLDNVSISGRVLDQNGALVTGARVQVILLQTGVERSTSTDPDGRFRLVRLAPGAYSIRITRADFAIYERKDLTAVSGQTLQLDLTLYPLGVTVDPITVTPSDPSDIDTTRTVVGGTITTSEIESLPIITRSPLDLIFLLGGVTEEPLSIRDLAEDRNTTPNGTPEEAGIFSLAGGPAYSNNITIDGLDNNDDRAARERFQPSLEAIEEVQIITNQFSSEYGRASGGRVNLRTRGGGQKFRGRAFYFFRDEALNANTLRNNSFGLKRLPFQEHNPGFNFGGPMAIPGTGLVKRTVFFTSYEFRTVLDSTLVDTLVPVQQNPLFPLPGPTTLTGRRLEAVSEPALAAEIAPFRASFNTPSRNHRFTTRIDHKFSDTHTGALVYQMGRLINLRRFSGGNRLVEALQTNTRKSDSLSYSDTFVLSASLVNQTRFQMSRLLPAIQAQGGTNPVVLIAINDPLEQNDVERRSGTLIGGSSTTGSTGRRESRFQIQNVLDLQTRTHSFKIGFDIQRVHSTFIDLADVSGTFNFASAGDFLAGVPSRFRQNFLTESTQRNTYLSLFFQDEWQVSQNLKLSYGLRYERETILRDRNNFAPRLSIAYDPFGTGKTVVRMGAGIFYNRVLLRTIDDFTLGAQQRFFDTNSLRDPVTDRLLSADERRAFIAAHITFPAMVTINSPLVQQFGVLNTGFSRRLEPGLRIPESYQANIGLERNLGRRFIVEANYTFNRGIHLWREFNVNAPVLPAGFSNFTEYLISRDFANLRRGPSGLRPLYNAANAGELVRFALASANPSNPNVITRMVEFGVPLSLISLNSLSSTAIQVALAALTDLRPDPTRSEIEQLIAAGNSFYRGLTVELRKAFRERNLSFSFRTSYTLSHLVDDGIVNTSDALRPGDFRAERARSLLDRRHRFVLSGTLELPVSLGRMRLSPIVRLTSGAPFNISIGGADRNLDDVGNDRPSFAGDPKLLRWRRPGQSLDPSLLNLFRLPVIGQSGDLPRNAGQGPGQFYFDLNLTRQFHLSEKLKLRPVIEFHNVLNKSVFSFGTEFINFNALGSQASPEQKQAFLDSFLVTTRTLRPRQLRLGIRLDF